MSWHSSIALLILFRCLTSAKSMDNLKFRPQYTLSLGFFDLQKHKQLVNSLIL